jgi:hypothetical protein
MLGNPAISSVMRPEAFRLLVSQELALVESFAEDAVKRRSRSPSPNGKLKTF